MPEQPDEIAEHWPITAADRLALVQALMNIIQSDDYSLALRACRIVLQMDALNLHANADADRALRAKVGRLRVRA